ncbi:MAG: hypothetical protein Q9186_007673 [Xanthomendoza sp. 1 TL-2023]
MYIVTAADDVARALKNTHALVFHDYLNQLLSNFGVGNKTRRLLWYEAKPDDPLYLPDDLVTPRQKSVSFLTEEVYRQQLLPGENMDSMCKVFMDSVKDTLQWHHLDFCTTATFPGSRRKQISLNALCRYTMVDAATRSMFGAYLHKFEPDIVEHILGLNDSIWMIIFRYPNAFASAVNAPRSKIMDAMKKFISLPEEQRSEQSWSVKTVLQAQEHVGIDLENQASILLILLWATNSNGYNTSFWLLTYLLFNPSLLHAAQTEIAAACSPTGTLDIKQLCTHSPTLDATFAETLRVHGGAMIARKISTETTIGGKILEKGHTVIIPTHQLHTNQQVWGTDVDQFDAFRFDKKKALKRHSSYRPFGGGATYCPGRVLAKEEVFGFVAVLLRRFRVEVVEGQEVPDVDEGVPGVGITAPVKGMDVLVEVEPV